MQFCCVSCPWRRASVLIDIGFVSFIFTLFFCGSCLSHFVPAVIAAEERTAMSVSMILTARTLSLSLSTDVLLFLLALSHQLSCSISILQKLKPLVINPFIKLTHLLISPPFVQTPCFSFEILF